MAIAVGMTIVEAGSPGATTGLTGPRTATANIVAVAQGGGGTVGQVTVKIVPGSGKVLLDTNPFVETDTQFSAKTAKSVAEQVTGVSLDDRNVVYTFSIRGDYLGGPSAGAAMTVATIAAIRNATVRQDAVITGTVRPDGRIGQVGGVVEKAVAAGNNGMDLFLVPEGQETMTYYERRVEEERVGPGFAFRDVRYVPRTVDLSNLTTERFGMAVDAV
ncbi:MAG: S16 family serine protease, partial [Candidatus Nanohaloarchaea archaeon]